MAMAVRVTLRCGLDGCPCPGACRCGARGAVQPRMLISHIPPCRRPLVIATTLSVRCFAFCCTAAQTRPVPNVALSSPHESAIECFLDCLGQPCPLPTAPVSRDPFTSGARAGPHYLAATTCATLTVRGARGGGGVLLGQTQRSASPPPPPLSLCAGRGAPWSALSAALGASAHAPISDLTLLQQPPELQKGGRAGWQGASHWQGEGGAPGPS